MRRLLLALTIVLGMSIPCGFAHATGVVPVCPQSKHAPSQWRTFSNAEYGVRFSYPRTLSMQEIDVENPPTDLYPFGLRKNVRMVIRLKGPTTHVIFNIDAKTEPLQNLDSYVQDVARTLKLQTKESGGVYRTLSIKESCFGGKRALVLVGKETYGEDEVYFAKRVIMETDNAMYGVTFAGLTKEYRKNLKTFQKMVDSFEYSD